MRRGACRGDGTIPARHALPRLPQRLTGRFELYS